MCSGLYSVHSVHCLYTVHAERDELACANDSWVSAKINDAIYCKLEEVVMEMLATAYICLCGCVQYMVHANLDDDIAVLYEAKTYIVHCYTLSNEPPPHHDNLVTNN